MQFDPQPLRRYLDVLPPKHRTAFAATCCERLLPNYSAFSQEIGWGRPEILRIGLDYVWSVLDGGSVDRSRVDWLIEECDSVIPDTEDFDTSSVSAALDAGTAVVATLRSLLDDDPEHVVGVAAFCWDTVHMYIQDRDDLVYSDPLVNTKIAQDRLIKRELARQAATLAELARHPTIDSALLRRLRDEATDNGRSNIGRTALKSSS